MSMKFYKCKIKGQEVNLILDKKVVPSYVNEVIDSNGDEFTRKQIPIYAIDINRNVTKVGSLPRPIGKSTLVKWILLVTKKVSSKINLKPTDLFNGEYILNSSTKVVAIYAYCHGSELLNHRLHSSHISEARSV